MQRSTSASTLPKRHARFYLDYMHGDVIFQAGNVLYNVHKDLLMNQSPVFADMFSFQSDEGASDEKPIILEGTTPFEFECFLSCIYPKRSWRLDDMPFKAWVSVLQFAAKWQFNAIHDKAMAHLGRIRVRAPTLVRHIAFAKTHSPGRWYQEVIRAMCERDPLLTKEEAAVLGDVDIIRISAIRHRVRVSQWKWEDGEIGISEMEYRNAEKQTGMHWHASGLAPAADVAPLNATQKSETLVLGRLKMKSAIQRWQRGVGTSDSPGWIR